MTDSDLVIIVAVVAAALLIQELKEVFATKLLSV
jgi:hypothetical protein